MAPTKGSAKGKADSKKSNPLASASKVSKKKAAKRPPPQEVKSKARTEASQLKKTKKREYSEAELDLPKLNSITPVGVVKPKGKKKGKVFVDDPVRSTFSPIDHVGDDTDYARIFRRVWRLFLLLSMRRRKARSSPR
jgi:hypothetical protein